MYFYVLDIARVPKTESLRYGMHNHEICRLLLDVLLFFNTTHNVLLTGE